MTRCPAPVHLRWVGATLAAVAVAGSAHAATLSLSPDDTGSLFVDFATTPPDVRVEADTFVFRRQPQEFNRNDLQVPVFEFDLGSINPDGLFGAATFRGEVARNNAGGDRRFFRPEVIPGNGLVDLADAGSFAANNSFNDQFSYDPATELGVDFSFDAGSAVRSLLRRGEPGVALRVNPVNGQAPSIARGVSLTLEDYFEDPLDAVPAITGETGLAFRGQPGNFVTDGEAFSFDADDLTDVRGIFAGGQRLSFDNGSDRFSLELGAGDGGPLEAGRVYTAGRFGFQDPGEAGFDLSGNGRGNNELDAEFTVLGVEYDAEGALALLDATFRFEGDGDAGAAFGRVAFNVPEPAAGLLLAAGLAALSGRRRGRA